MTYSLSYQMGEGGKTSTLKLAVLTALFSWSPPWIVGITGDSVHPDMEDPDAEVSLDAWITEIWDYLKDNILPDEHVSAERIICVAKRYMLVEGELYWRGANGNLMQCITRKMVASCSRRSMEVGAATILHPTRWLAKPFGIAFTGLYPFKMPSSW
jgi:hypothetical protein